MKQLKSLCTITKMQISTDLNQTCTLYLGDGSWGVDLRDVVPASLSTSNLLENVTTVKYVLQVTEHHQAHPLCMAIAIYLSHQHPLRTLTWQHTVIIEKRKRLSGLCTLNWTRRLQFDYLNIRTANNPSTLPSSILLYSLLNSFPALTNHQSTIAFHWEV